MPEISPIEYGVRPPKFRLPAATRLGGVTLQVADLARSLAFYQHVLGLRAIEQSGTHALLGAEGSDAPLVRLRERKGAHSVPRRGLLGLFHFAILLPNRPALGRFLQHLADLGVQPGMSDHLVSEAIYLQDPDNLGIEVYADRPRSTWKHAMGQLEMATMPLEAGDVIAAGGGEPWKGMPAGTTMGHVHLHVGEIEPASAFYHDALGFDKIVWSYPGALFLSAGGYHHHLGTNTWAHGAPSAGDEDAKLLEWEIVLPTDSNVEAAARSLTAGSHPVERDGVAAIARDPWGTRLRLRAHHS
jgi:catechol 2,3-dioxygenase